MNDLAAFDREALRRFDRPGPRYAAYPSPAQFGPHFDAEMLRTYIRQSNTEPIPRRLALDLQVPRLDRSRVYVERLIREVELVGPMFDRDREVVQLHLGGAASRLTADELRELLASVRSHFWTQQELNLSIDLSLHETREDMIAIYVELGIMHASIGATATHSNAQAIGHFLRVCRARGMRSLEWSVILGLPERSPGEFERFLDAVIAAPPDRVSLQEYPSVSYLSCPRDIRSMTQATRRLQFETGVRRLTEAGYVHLGMDAFVRPDDVLARARAAGTLQRNLLGYTAHTDCDVVGLGVGAISHVGDCFSQNQRDLRSWEQAIDAGRLPVARGRHLDFDDTLRADVIGQIVCLGSIDIATLERRYLIDFRRYFADACARLAALENDGLVAIMPERIATTSRGRWLLRIIAACFDRYLNEPIESALRRKA